MPLPLSIKTQNGNPVHFTPNLPAIFSDQEIHGAKSYYAYNKSYGYLIYQQVASNGYTAWMNHFIITNPAEFVVTANVDDLLLHHTIKGKMSYLIDQQEVETEEHQMNLLVANRLCNIIRFSEPGIYTALTVHIPLSKLEEFNDSFPVVQRFVEKVNAGNAVMLLEQNMITHARIRNIVQDITERRLLSSAGEKYRVQKTGELVIESLDMLSRYMIDKDGLTPTDHEKGKRTEVFLLAHLQQSCPPTLKQLSAFSGVNEKKLEHIFKSRHKVTIYDFFQNARMSIIYERLTETTMPLQNIADDFGYTDYSSFSYAVKKRFSFGPRELRRSLIDLLSKTALVSYFFITIL
jgi:AraC-like DNA-binding protein